MIAVLPIIILLLRATEPLQMDPTTLNINFKATKKFCIQDLHTNLSNAYFQHKLTKIVYKTQEGTTVNAKSFPFASFKKMQCIGSRKISLLASNNFISLYDTFEDSYRSFEGVEVTDVTYVKESESIEKVVYISNFSSVRIKNVPLNSSEEVYKLNGSFSSIVCSTYRNKSLDGYCFILSQNRTLIKYFNTLFPEKVYQKQMVGFKVVKISEMTQRIYIGFQFGQIKEYSFKQGLMLFERSTKISQDSSIIDLAINQLRNQLIYLNANLKTGIISLASGFQIGSSLACQAICTDSSKIILFSSNQFAFFTPSLSQTIRPFLNPQAIIDSTSVSLLNPLKALCLTGQLYFNSTLQKCTACQNGCSLCDEETGVCFSCLEGYFMKDSQCFHCKYTSLDQEKYQLCFQENQIHVLALSNTVAPVIVSGIQSTYSILSGSALLFLFIRFINFWSLISMYYFLNIEVMPYFLLQFLSKIFTILYGSVFEYFGIDVTQINMGIQERETNQKMKFTKISTDFVASNFQSVVTFLYSIVLICVLYDSIKNWFLKFKIHVFQKVKLQACLQEFMGIFIPLVVPLSYFLTNLTAVNTLNQINNGLFIMFLGIGAIFPFIYITLIVKRITLKQRLAMIKEQIHQNLITSQKNFDPPVQKTAEIHESQQPNEKEAKAVSNNLLQKPCRRKAFRIKETAGLNLAKITQKPMNFVTQQEGQKFLYCLNAFWSPFLVGFGSPGYFLGFGVLINFMSVCNAFYASHWRPNIILEKCILFTYHLCFVLMVLFPSLNFTVSLLAISLIICGGVHELITAVAQKVYFIYLVVKNKKILRDNRIAQQELSKSQKNIISIFQLNSKFQSVEAQNPSENNQRIQQPTFKSIIESKTVPNFGTKTIIKKTKFIQGNHPAILLKNKTIQSAFHFDNLTSIKSIKLDNHSNQAPKDQKRVIFEQVTNSKQASKTHMPIYYIKIQADLDPHQSLVQNQNSNFEESRNVQKSSINWLEDKQEKQYQLPKLNKTALTIKSKENYGTQNEFSANAGENYVSKSVVNLKYKVTKQSRFLKVISTKHIQKKTDQMVSIKTFEQEKQADFK